jgi:hypothetical protein
MRSVVVFLTVGFMTFLGVALTDTTGYFELSSLATPVWIAIPIAVLMFLAADAMVVIPIVTKSLPSTRTRWCRAALLLTILGYVVVIATYELAR